MNNIVFVPEYLCKDKNNFHNFIFRGTIYTTNTALESCKDCSLKRISETIIQYKFEKDKS